MAQTSGNPGNLWIFGADSPVAAYPAGQQLPVIDGNVVVWEDCRDVIRCQLYFKNIAALEPESPVTENLSHQTEPAIDGSRIVWRQRISTPSGYQIYFAELGGSPAVLSTSSNSQSLPAISGSRVVWQDERAGSRESDIYMYDLATDMEIPLCTESSTQQNPAIDGDWVAWVDNRGGTYIMGSPTKNDIYVKNVVTGEERRLTFDERDVIQGSPDISGNRIVWHGDGIWLYDLATGQTAKLADEGGRPEIDGDRIVWEGRPLGGPNRKVHLYDLSTNTSQPVTAGLGSVYHPHISGNYIVWTDARNTDRNIYSNRLGDKAGALAERYAPELHFKHDIMRSDRNDLEPRTVSLLVDGAERLVYSGGEVENPAIQELIDHPGEDSYLDLPGSPANPFHSYGDDYKSQLEKGDYPLTAYTRVVQKAEGTDKTVIQYWFNYYYNNWYNNHEGDWEMVEVILNDNLEPEDVAYAQHGWPWKKGWNEWGVKKTGTHPRVFVAEGSHASYFFASSELHFLEPGTPNAFKDETGSASSVIPAVDMNSLNGGWADYAGRWGQTKPLLCWWCENGPKGPAFQPRDPWNQPITWASSSLWKWLANDMAIAVYSPAEINLYDAQGRHVGKNAQGGIDLEIPGSEYFERDDDHSKNIVIHNADILTNYTLKVQGTGAGVMDLKIQAPDFSGNMIENPQYLAVSVNPAMQAELDLNAAKDFDLKVDEDGDGAIDTVISPDTNDQVAFDFSPPATVTDLAVEDTTSGTTTLNWTAPGDDGVQGTAFRYDLRYSTEPITEDNWQYAKTAGVSPEPQPSGSRETATVTGLDAGITYYFAIKARDDAWQESALSNAVQSTTEIPNLTWGIRRIYWASWDDYYARQLSIDYNLGNNGTGLAINPTIATSICIPTSVYVTTLLPFTAGDLNPGSINTVTLKYYVPTSVGSFTATAYASCGDDAGRLYWFPGPLP